MEVFCMASVTKVRLVDDIDGGEADETVAFDLEGKNYQIDLSKTHAAQLREVLAPYVAAARRAREFARGAWAAHHGDTSLCGSPGNRGDP